MWNMSLTISALLLSLLSFSAVSQDILEDGGVGISRVELEQIIKRWTPQMREAAANDKGDRLELLNVALGSKKIAQQGDKLTAEADGDTYWKYILTIRSTKQGFILRNFMDTLVVPDMTELSKERYTTQKDKYARVKERRYSSHILFMCLPGQCDRSELKVKAQVVLDELRQGADFVEMVHQYSEDKGTKAKDGLFDHWMELGEAGVTPPYSGGLFEIGNIGEYADLVESQFGVHIIRLDGIRESHYLPYEEVKDTIITRLTNEYKKLSAKQFNAQFIITDKAFIDGKAMDDIFAPYKTTE